MGEVPLVWSEARSCRAEWDWFVASRSCYVVCRDFAYFYIVCLRSDIRAFYTGVRERAEEVGQPDVALAAERCRA
eukprot:9297845-Alexandrium_andersonii.AAC.1